MVAAPMADYRVVMTEPAPNGQDTYLETTAAFARRTGAVAAMNTNFFRWLNANSLRSFQDYQKWVMGELKPEGIDYGALRQTCLSGRGTIPAGVLGAYIVNGQVVRPYEGGYLAIVHFPAQGGMEFYRGSLPAQPFHVVSGSQQLLEGGRKLPVDDSDRTSPKAILGRRGNEYIFVVSDGRGNGGSPGLSFPQLQAFLLEQGVTDATAVDGGESTTLVVQGQVKNHPRDRYCELARWLPAPTLTFIPPREEAREAAMAMGRSLRPVGANIGLVPREQSRGVLSFAFWERLQQRLLTRLRAWRHWV
ncbi:MULTISPECIES: phosphodiester glycosidase family protein [unclassified Thermosynechococcus]|nr:MULTISPECIES: phosphodiester glycosidase family protein [unclassified Thermosynechococcus]WNC36400.1 phosphodiester glycosidase family protein [Thermosynechococcus sp. WL11]WNC38921.1 phosphodiester glycosidase family protein [Thermosynechococcus sp. WL17]WNC41443.1 phosphodiester glycosidase family protein [Thermosynechococcus sp. WL15]WNC43963.1 phosphodiester glycosidase family protein [Thermosynechococcus sp. GLH187]WNC46499.1 phosphodiester glycosidase family protein [Thermosynechococc